MEIGLERVDVQISSKLAIGMEKLFDGIMVYRDSLTDVSPKVKIRLVLQKAHKMLPKLKTLIEKEVGVKIVGFQLSERPMLNFAIVLQLGKENEDIDLHEILINSRGIQPPIEHTVDAKELQKTLDSLDKSKARVNNITLKKVPLEIVLFLDLYCMFLSKESVNQNLRRLSAKELTAIELHEIGHFITSVENITKKSYAVTSSLDAVNYFNKYASNDEKIKFVKNNLKDLKVSQAVDKASGDNKQINNKGNKVLWLFILLINMILIVPAFIQRIIFNYDSGTMPDLNLSNDLKTNKNNYSIAERLSDEFVSVFGYSEYLVTSLELLGDYSTAILLQPAFKITASLNTIIFTNMLVNIASQYDSTGGGIYPKITERYQEILRDNIAILRQTNISTEIKNYYFKVCESTLKQIEKHNKNTKLDKRQKAIERFLSKAISPKGLFDMMVNARFSSEYNLLLDMTSNLINNKLYMAAHKFKKLKK